MNARKILYNISEVSGIIIGLIILMLLAPMIIVSDIIFSLISGNKKGWE